MISRADLNRYKKQQTNYTTTQLQQPIHADNYNSWADNLNTWFNR